MTSIHDMRQRNKASVELSPEGRILDDFARVCAAAIREARQRAAIDTTSEENDDLLP